MKTRVTIPHEEIHRILGKAEVSRQKDYVSEMTGIASLREPAPGSDPRYDFLKAKYLR